MREHISAVFGDPVCGHVLQQPLETNRVVPHAVPAPLSTHIDLINPSLRIPEFQSAKSGSSEKILWLQSEAGEEENISPLWLEPRSQTTRNYGRYLLVPGQWRKVCMSVDAYSHKCFFTTGSLLRMLDV